MYKLFNEFKDHLYKNRMPMSHFFLNSYKMGWLYKRLASEILLPQFDRTTCLEML